MLDLNIKINVYQWQAFEQNITYYTYDKSTTSDKSQIPFYAISFGCHHPLIS